MFKLLSSYLLIVILSFSCSKNTETDTVASVYDVKLDRTELSYIFEGDESEKDSLAIANQYINEWVLEQVLVAKAKANSKLNLISIENKVNHYRNTLLIFENENLFIQNNLDTTITETEYQNYYSKHQSDFQLNDYLVKVIYLKISNDAPDLNLIDKWYKLKNEKDILLIETYAKQYASNFYYDAEHWMYFDQLTKEIPLDDINKDRFITRKMNKKIHKGNYYYYLNILDYKLKNSTSPLDFERENIKKRILNLRVIELRKKYKENNLQKAKNEKAITIY